MVCQVEKINNCRGVVLSRLGNVYKRAHKGFFLPNFPEKCINKIPSHGLLYRSGLERKSFFYMDNTDSVVRWGSELVKLQYVLNNKLKTYITDLYVEVRNKNGEIDKYIIEVKHSKKTRPPKPQKRRTKLYESLIHEWHMNQAKWSAARKYCEAKGYKFMILTEKELN